MTLYINKTEKIKQKQRVMTCGMDQVWYPNFMIKNGVLSILFISY